MSHGAEARRLLRRCHQGALGTLSCKHSGYPYVSLVPCMLDAQANPVLLISRLAEHTKNIDAHEKTSFAAHDPGEDIQASARLTMLGSCRRANDSAMLAVRYLRYFPDAARLLELDFDFYRLEPVSIRYIGGFGAVHWISSQSFRAQYHSLAAIEDDVLGHMNTDHARSLVDYCRHVHQLDASTASMIGVDCDGFDVRADGQLLRFEFPDPVHDAASLRTALVALAEESRR